MSTLRAATLSNIAGTGSPVITAGELSRARFNLNGTGTIAARDSFNVASFTDNGAGDYTATFTTAMPNADTSPMGQVNQGTETATSSVRSLVFISVLVGSVRNICLLQSNVATDFSYVAAAIFGDIP